MMFYINGTGETETISGGTVGVGRGDLAIMSNNALGGKLDQFRIFNKAISSSEVTTLYGETSASSTKSTTDIFNDSSGIALYELEGNANDTGGVTGRTEGTESAIFSNADNSNFNLGNATVVNNSFGVSFWVKMNKISQSENVYLCSFMYGSNTSLYMDTSNVLQVTNGGYSRNESFSTTHTFAADTWYHIVYTGQIAGDGTLRCYVNGTQVGSRGWISGHNYTLTSGNRIGSYNNGDYSIDGQIADFRIYKSTHLSSSDVTALYSGTPPTTGLTEYYKFDGNAQNYAGDRQLTPSNVIYNYSGTATNVSYAYDGTPTNVSFVGTSFEPDLVWTKRRDTTGNHLLYDSIRGAGFYLSSNSTGNQNGSAQLDTLASFDSNGFTVGTSAGSNANGGTYAAWCWKAASSDSTNTDGTITSTVRANQDAGFSIVKYTGNSTAGATVGHGLVTAPEFVIYKRTDTTANWIIKSSILGVNNYLTFTTDQSYPDSGVFWNSTLPSSSVFTLGNSASVNVGNYIAYCFHSVAGYQKVGTYSGNGSTTGPIVTTGFRPRFILTKPSSIADNWSIWDNTRDPGNTIDQILVPNTSGAESADGFGRYDIDLLSNGFQIKRTDSQVNQNGATYIYLAIK